MGNNLPKEGKEECTHYHTNEIWTGGKAFTHCLICDKKWETVGEGEKDETGLLILFEQQAINFAQWINDLRLERSGLPFKDWIYIDGSQLTTKELFEEYKNKGK